MFKTYRLSSSWLWANAWATRSKRNERAVNGDAAPPELESPPVDDMPCISSRDISPDKAGRLSYKFDVVEDGIKNNKERCQYDSCVVKLHLVDLFTRLLVRFVWFGAENLFTRYVELSQLHKSTDSKFKKMNNIICDELEVRNRSVAPPKAKQICDEMNAHGDWRVNSKLCLELL